MRRSRFFFGFFLGGGGDIKFSFEEGVGVVGGLLLGILQCEFNKFDFPGEG